MNIIALSLTTLGEVLIGATILLVHHKMLKQRKLDRFVLHEIRIEQILGFLGMGFIITGYLIQVLHE